MGSQIFNRFSKTTWKYDAQEGSEMAGVLQERGGLQQKCLTQVGCLQACESDVRADAAVSVWIISGNVLGDCAMLRACGENTWLVLGPRKEQLHSSQATQQEEN